MKTEPRRPRSRAAAAALLLLLAAFPLEARTPGKAVKPPRGAPPPAARALQMPEAWAAPAGPAHRVAAAAKSTSPAWWTAVRDPEQRDSPSSWRSTGRPARPSPPDRPLPRPRSCGSSPAARNYFRLRDPSSELVHRDTRTDRAGRRHVRLEQRHLGVPVWGAAIVGHWSAGRGLYGINGRYEPSPEHITEVEPDLSPGAAVARAVDHLSRRASIQPLGPAMQELLGYRGPEAGLYLWNARPGEPLRLTWNVMIRPNAHHRWHYFIDARSGEVLDRYQASPSDGPAVGRGVDLRGDTRDLHTLELDGGFLLVDGSRQGFDPGTWNGALVTLDAGYTDLEKAELIASSDNVFTDPAAVSAHANMGRIHEYFLSNHGRLGIFGDGSTMTSVVHVTQDGEPMDNAYWNGVQMAYGDGKEIFAPLAGALDVAAHEMTHGIIEHTVGLEYRFQSGALDESFADVFGALVDDDDWLMGEDIVDRTRYPTGAFRDLQDPHNGREPGEEGWQPAHMDEYMELDSDDDNGGVHVNSGIPNRAAFLLAEAIGRPKAGRIYYHILEAGYLTPRSQFVDCRLAAERAARDLFGDGSPEVEAVRSAYDAVGIAAPEPPAEPPPGDGTADPGAHWVAAVAGDPDGDNSLWIVKPTPAAQEGAVGWEHVAQLTPTQVFTGTGRAIAAPVNGDYLLFVDADNNLRFIQADGGGETVIDGGGDWSSIALSPDGNRLAATTVYDEPLIYYIDLVEPDNSRAVELYHPTTQDGILQPIARYADALQWDAAGAYVIYDVFNSLPGPDGQRVEFWTVNVLDPTGEAVWSLFPPQPEGVQIGNPSLSSAVGPDGTIDDCRLLYERFDQPGRRVDIGVMDFCTGEEGVLLSLGDDFFTFPGFANGDREIVFEWWAEEEGVEGPHLLRLPLGADGLSSAGEPVFFLPYSQAPRTFVLASGASAGILGETSVEEQASAPRPEAPALAQNYPNPFNAETLISYSVPSEGRVVLDVFNIHGQRVAAVDQGLRAAGTHTLRWAGVDAGGRPLASGVYFYRLRRPGGAGEVEGRTRKMLLLR